jgi:hypothetical protein
MKVLKFSECGAVESQIDVKIVDAVKGMEIRETKIILTGPDHQKVLLIILLAKDYELCFFDLKQLIIGENTHPIKVTYPYSTYEFDYVISLNGLNHRYYLV